MTGTCFDSTIGASSYALYHGDCVLALPGLPDASIGLSVSSWPFSDQYAYSPSVNDFGNCDGDADFFEQMTYLLPELLRVTIPGRFAIVHCKDRIIYGSRNNGYRHVEPFSDKVTADQPAVGRVADGVSRRMDRVGYLGNAVVPQCAEIVGRFIVAHNNIARATLGKQ
jgi:hypothetical protein